MKSNPAMVLVMICLGLAAAFVGHKFLIIDFKVGKYAESSTPHTPPVSVEPIFTAQPLPETGGERFGREVGEISDALDDVMSQGSVPQQDAPGRDLERMLSQVSRRGGTIVDRRMFPTMNACQATVARVAAEYKRRRAVVGDVQDSLQTWGSPGIVLPFVWGGNASYLACLRDDKVPWGAYIQFKVVGQ